MYYGNNGESIVCEHRLSLAQAWSILPALDLLPIDCSHRKQKGSKTGGVTPMQAKWDKFDLDFLYKFMWVNNAFE